MSDNHTTRRAVLSTGLALPLATAPQILASAQLIDPHPQWLIDWRKAREDWINASDEAGDETPESEAHFARLEEIAELIFRTPAQTPKGVEAQLRWVKEDSEDEYNYEGYRFASENALDALAGMA